MSPARALPHPMVTNRTGDVGVSALIPAPMKARLEHVCRLTGVPQCEFIRRAIEQRLEQFVERSDG